MMMATSSSTAFAHHPIGGGAPDTALMGFLSGIGHPVIGIDHLAFVIAVGIIAAMQRSRLMVPAGFIGGTILGTVISVGLFVLPFAETMVTLSVLAAGILAMRGRVTAALPTTILFAVAGIFHGWAYGAAVIGAEMTPIIAYLAGFSLVQFSIVIATGLALRTIWKASSADAIQARLAGAMIAGVGLTFLVEQAEAYIFPAM